MELESLTSSSNLLDESTRISANSPNMESKSQKSTPIWADYKFHIHPIIKLFLFGVLNIAAFLPSFQQTRWIILGIEIFLAFGIKLEIYRIQGFFKFLLMNFFGIYILFFFVDYK